MHIKFTFTSNEDANQLLYQTNKDKSTISLPRFREKNSRKPTSAPRAPNM